MLGYGQSLHAQPKFPDTWIHKHDSVLTSLEPVQNNPLLQVFSGLCLNAVISVVSSTAALLVFNFFLFFYLMCLYSYHSAVVPLLSMFGFCVCLGQFFNL